MLLFILPLLTSALDNSNCALVSCKLDVTESDFCILYNNETNSVFLNNVTCAGGCNFSQLYLEQNGTWFSDQCILPNITGQPTGATCTDHSNCSSNICSSPVCYGVPQGNYCYNSEACQPGYYCLNNTCTGSLNPGDSCTIHEECPIGYGCDTNATGICTLLFSKDQNESTSDAKLCKSNFMYNGACDSLLVYRFGEELLPPFNCKVSETCVYKSKFTGNVWAELPCTCAGLPKKGGGYCSYFAEKLDKVVNDDYIFLTYSSSNCGGNWTHTDDPDILYNCGSITIDQYLYFHNLVGRSRYLAVYESGSLDECADFFQFYNLTAEYNPSVYTFGVFIKVGLLGLLTFLI